MAFQKEAFTESFISETQEHLEQIDNKIIQLRASPKDKNLLQAILRDIHTVKGTARMLGYSTYSSYRVISDVSETPVETETKINGPRFGDEAGFGLSYRIADKYRFELDYTISNWKNSGFDTYPGLANENFSSGVAQSLKAGFELTPNRNDIRYYMRRVSYRAGMYWEKSNYLVNGRPVNDIGISVGATFPVFRWYNGLTVSLQAGQRGTATGGMIRERYFGFSFGANIFDIWFQKPHYE